MLTGYAEIFQDVYGMNPGVGGLPYFGMVAGELIAFFVVVYQNPAYVKKLKANDNIPVPEWRGKFISYVHPNNCGHNMLSPFLSPYCYRRRNMLFSGIVLAWLDSKCNIPIFRTSCNVNH